MAKDEFSENYREAIKRIPLKTRFKVATEMSMIDLIVNLGFRENKMWDESDEQDMALLGKIQAAAADQTDHILELLSQWESDGSPE